MTVKKTHTFTLSEPVTIEGTEYSTLTLRKLKAKDIAASDLVRGKVRQGYAIFASMADVPIQVIDELDADDIERLGVEAAPLMGKRGQAMLAALEMADDDQD